jgi:hypothetical protein
VQAIEKLRNSRTFLRSARAYKGAAERAPAELEREVLKQARYARDEANIFVARALTTVRHLKATGILDRAFDVMPESFMSAGPVSISEIQRDLAEQFELPASLRESGVSEDLIKECRAELPEIDGMVSGTRDGIIVMTDPNDNEFAIIKRTGIKGSRSVRDLLFGNRFDAVVDRFERTGIMRALYAPTLSTRRRSKQRTLDELVLLGSGRLHAQMNHHVRQLEQIGLARYRGEAEFIVGLFVVGLAITIFAALGIVVCCSTQNKDCCIWAIVFLAVGWFFLFIGDATLDFSSDPAVGIETHGNPGSPEPSL